jgi:hypothetical protein
MSIVVEVKVRLDRVIGLSGKAWKRSWCANMALKKGVNECSVVKMMVANQ